MNILQITCLYKDDKYDYLASLSFPFTIKRGVRTPTGVSTNSIFTYLAKLTMEGAVRSWNDEKIKKMIKFHVMYSDLSVKVLSYADYEKKMHIY